MGLIIISSGFLVLRLENPLYLKNEYMNWAGDFNADSDAVVFGWTDILLFDF